MRRAPQGMWTLASLTLLGCAGQRGPSPSALPPSRPSLPAPSAKAIPDTPPAGVQLHLTGEQKGSLVALLLAGQAAFARGAYDVAEQIWLEAAQLDPSNVDARLGLGRVWLLRAVAGDDAGYRARAHAAFAFVVQTCPEHAQARRLLGLVATEAPPSR